MHSFSFYSENKTIEVRESIFKLHTYNHGESKIKIRKGQRHRILLSRPSRDLSFPSSYIFLFVGIALTSLLDEAAVGFNERRKNNPPNVFVRHFPLEVKVEGTD